MSNHGYQQPHSVEDLHARPELSRAEDARYQSLVNAINHAMADTGQQIHDLGEQVRKLRVENQNLRQDFLEELSGLEGKMRTQKEQAREEVRQLREEMRQLREDIRLPSQGTEYKPHEGRLTAGPKPHSQSENAAVLLRDQDYRAPIKVEDLLKSDRDHYTSGHGWLSSQSEGPRDFHTKEFQGHSSSLVLPQQTARARPATLGEATAPTGRQPSHVRSPTTTQHSSPYEFAPGVTAPSPPDFNARKQVLEKTAPSSTLVARHLSRTTPMQMENRPPTTPPGNVHEVRDRHLDDSGDEEDDDFVYPPPPGDAESMIVEAVKIMSLGFDAPLTLPLPQHRSVNMRKKLATPEQTQSPEVEGKFPPPPVDNSVTSPEADIGGYLEEVIPETQNVPSFVSYSAAVEGKREEDKDDPYADWEDEAIMRENPTLYSIPLPVSSVKDQPDPVAAIPADTSVPEQPWTKVSSNKSYRQAAIENPPVAMPDAIVPNRKVFAPGGNRGAHVSSGERGAHVSSGERGARALRGRKRARASRGERGASASRGERGAQAASGNRGSQAPRGTRGSQGPRGTRGSQGPRGTRGHQDSDLP